MYFLLYHPCNSSLPRTFISTLVLTFGVLPHTQGIWYSTSLWFSKPSFSIWWASLQSLHSMHFLYHVTLVHSEILLPWNINTLTTAFVMTPPLLFNQPHSQPLFIIHFQILLLTMWFFHCSFHLKFIRDVLGWFSSSLVGQSCLFQITSCNWPILRLTACPWFI